MRQNGVLVHNPRTSLPYYLPRFDEKEIFEKAHQRQVPILLKGPTGCGKTRLVEHMAGRLHVPLYTVPCHDDLTASDLIGRYLIKDGNTVWIDGPMTRAVRDGGICYLDEVVEARKDTIVVIHPLTDDRRQLFIERTGETLKAPANFQLVISFNPGYQNTMKTLKPSTRQRFVALDLDWPSPEQEAAIVAHESGVDDRISKHLVHLAQKIRPLKNEGLEEVPSTRTLVLAARMIVSGVAPQRAAEIAMGTPLTEDDAVLKTIVDLAQFEFENAVA